MFPAFGMPLGMPLGVGSTAPEPMGTNWGRGGRTPAAVEVVGAAWQRGWWAGQPCGPCHLLHLHQRVAQLRCAWFTLARLCLFPISWDTSSASLRSFPSLPARPASWGEKRSF